MTGNPLSAFEAYRKKSRRRQKLCFGEDIHGELIEVVRSSLSMLEPLERKRLTSRVSGKSYFEFVSGESASRCVNEDLFDGDQEAVIGGLRQILSGSTKGMDASRVARVLYTAAISFCAVVDLLKKGDQKTPGTFFEYLCAPVLRSFFQVDPVQALDVLNLDLNTRLPTDLVFDLGAKKPKFHVPVKTSTRERIIQVFAHQRVLDGAYGTGRFLGMPIVLTETKTDGRTKEVTEICLPDQWMLYHLHIATFWRVVYFDLPTAYGRLRTEFPPVPVIGIGEFLSPGGPLEEIVARHGSAS